MNSSQKPESADNRPSAQKRGSHSPPNPTSEKPLPKKKKKYVPAVTPRLRIFLYLVFGLFALLTANSIYLASITALEAITQKLYQDYFYIWMFLLHLVLGILIILPFIVFVVFHLKATYKRKNRAAVRVGYVLLLISVLLLLSGIGLTRNIIDLKSPAMRALVYWIHVLTPIGAIWLYCIHRLSGPPIKWKVGVKFAAVTAVVILGMVIFQAQDPRDFNTAGSPESAE
ncbi:MAG: hypothetical protein VX438_15365, partial [Planctomycetota bacterium]|nr:hypothetical protein [Planctomycetota bacterium]